ncbi:response regulator [Clostridium sp. AN503]|uniref:response regulator transcription factor n=1 Tax=Clostridium sp. AN503 TaxID=3160598 RepID=UPI0034584FFE
MLKVLVIDDEMFVRKGIVLETDWAALGCEVVAEAANGVEGIEAVHKYSPDLIISDIRMPKLDGIGMLRALREEGSRVEVIFLTAYSEFEYAREALKLLAFDYLLKPFEDGELEEAVTKVRKRIEERREDTGSQEEKVLSLKQGGAQSGYIQEALAYIAEHYGDGDISVGTIAESLGLSEGHLSHLFKKETDYTVMSYITRYRMRAAMKLLENCRYKVYEVAEMVGYKDITYFSSTFKKIVGVSPSEYQSRRR